MHTSPALAMEMVCCSMASWIDALSASLMDENSSMQHTPRSASTKAPASSVHSLPSRTAAAVRPAEEVPTPEVKTLRGERRAANRRNWLLPVPGSPWGERRGTEGAAEVRWSVSDWYRRAFI